MTEGDKAFYKRRIREELKKASTAESTDLKRLHLRWALLYQERIDGTPKRICQELEARLRQGGYDFDEILAGRLRDVSMFPWPSDQPAQVGANAEQTT